ncbi:50S ribosomal protein L30 [Zavarzinia sp. CC-PAN008]|uniref:50S ribosomal protein L30 n=1 Tax=Zavarzinia sp. CC-PAN008 TaxID=3243332 RepID=UPI003F74A349
MSDAKHIRVTQVRSALRRPKVQEAHLKGLGLNKMHRSRVLVDTPAVRGLIEKVKHMIKVEPAE